MANKNKRELCKEESIIEKVDLGIAKTIKKVDKLEKEIYNINHKIRLIL